MSVPVISYDQTRAAQAFRLHQTLLKCLSDDPQLADDELFRLFQQEAFERFERAFKVTI
jgi:hypothetical protein